MPEIKKKILFNAGQMVATPGALQVLQELDIIQLLGWHVTGAWEEMEAQDRAANEQALQDGSRIFSSFDVNGQKIWVITEAVNDDGIRASTCIMLPEDY